MCLLRSEERNGDSARLRCLFRYLLTGISGIFGNNLPLSFSTALANSTKPLNVKVPGLFRYLGGQQESPESS